MAESPNVDPLGSLGQQPTVSPTEPITHTSQSASARPRFPWDEVVVLVFGVLLAEPFCHVGADLIMHDERLRGAISFAIGLFFGVAGASFHWWKHWAGKNTSQWVLKTADRWWPVALMLTFFYVSGLFTTRSVTPESPAPSADEIAAAVVKVLPKQNISTAVEIADAVAQRIPKGLPSPQGAQSPPKEAEPPNPLRPEATKWRAVSRLVQMSKIKNLSCKIILVKLQVAFAEDYANDLRQILETAQWPYQPGFALGDLRKGLSAIASPEKGMKRQCGETFQDAIMYSGSNGWPGGLFLAWEGPNPEQTYDPSVDVTIARCPNCIQVGIGNPK
jgi:hypothetical protein